MGKNRVLGVWVLVAGLLTAAPAMSTVVSSTTETTAHTVATAGVKKHTKVKKAKAKRGAVRKAAAQASEPVRLSAADQHSAGDPLSLSPRALRSSIALVLDQDTDEILFSKNSGAVQPIASLTKLMTAVVVVEAKQSLDDVLIITQDDVDTEKHSSSRLRVGTQLTRGEMLHLALMSSENRAAHALGRNYPGGLDAFVTAMNAKAQLIGMHDTHYVEPTGLSSKNQSSARDLAVLVKNAHEYSLIRELSTSPEYRVAIGKRSVEFRNTNNLVRSPSWEIGLQKTGYISEAGRCLVMQARLAGRQLIMVFLDSTGKYSRIADAERVRKWFLSTVPSSPAAAEPATTEPAMSTVAVKVSS